MHPSRAIRGARSRLLDGRKIVVGVTGSIAAVETVRIVRELIRHGAEVRAVMTPEAGRIVSPEALEFATGFPVVKELTGNVEHVSLLGPGEGRADLLLIAPATANTISKIANGIDDTVVTSFASIALGGKVPVILAPAMHGDMGRNPAVAENLGRLRNWGVEIVEPARTEGEEKLAGPEEIAAAVLRRLARGPWAGRKVVVVGGASREPIDDVRSVTNESSGRFAVALATAAARRGAKVELWAGALQVTPPAWIPVRTWSSVEDLSELIRTQSMSLAAADAVLVPAALADYVVARREGKIRSRDEEEITLRLRAAPRVLPLLRAAAPPPALLVASKLEAGGRPDELVKEARRLIREVRVDAVLANHATSMGAADTRLWMVAPSGTPGRAEGPKEQVADEVFEWLAPRLGRGRATRGRRSGKRRSG